MSPTITGHLTDRADVDPGPPSASMAGWLRGSRSGLFFSAVVVGVGAGFGAVAFRYLVFGLTWLATGSTQFGHLGRVASGHLPWLGVWFFVLIPVVGGLVYGPLAVRADTELQAGDEVLVLATQDAVKKINELFHG